LFICDDMVHLQLQSRHCSIYPYSSLILCVNSFNYVSWFSFKVTIISC
jgi:hypothetical protein